MLYLATGERKTRDRLAESLRGLVARGRAAGVIVLAATQKPSSDVVPTSVRDLFGLLRASLRPPAKRLTPSWALDGPARGYSAADIDPACRDIGYLLHEGGMPVRMRAAYPDDCALAAVARRAVWIRTGPES